MSHSDTISATVHRKFLERGETLALAESCTGGRIATELTAHAGASRYLLGSIVAYSNELKQKILGVKEETLHTKGAVSEEAVKEMLTGLLRVTSADWGIAVTGVAGPTGGAVGTIWGAIGRRGGPCHTYLLHLKGSREAIMMGAAQQLLEKILFLI